VLTINYRCGRQMVCSGNTQVLQIVWSRDEQLFGYEVTDIT
jgi:hypothetical protein